VCADDLYVLDKNLVNIGDWLLAYKHESVQNYAARHEGMWRTEGKASLILNLYT
jgi:hypothetical protein